MPDLEISNLPDLLQAGVAETDPLAIADESASETKQVTVKDLVGAGITFLASGAIPAAKVGTLGTNQVATGAIQDDAVTNDKIEYPSISLGGLTLVLGSTDATPALNLTDATNYPTSSLTGTITNAQLAGSIVNSKLTNSSVSFGGISLALGGTDATPAFNLTDATGYKTTNLVGTITNAQLAGSIDVSKLTGSGVSLGGVSVALGGTDATPAFNLTDATNYPTSSLVGTITNAQLAGSIANAKLANSTVSFGGISLALGGTDDTPAFNLTDATGYPASSLVGTITNAQLAGSIDVSKLAGTTAISLGGVSIGLGGTDATPAFNLTDATNYPAASLTGTISNAQLAGSIANAKLANSSVSLGGITVALGASDATPAFDLTDATGYKTTNLVGTITNTQLAGSIAVSKLTSSSASVGGVTITLGTTDATPAFNLTSATNYSTSALVGTITNAQLAGSIVATKLVSGSITSTQLGTNSVTATELADDAVDTGAVQNAAITNDKVQTSTNSTTGLDAATKLRDGTVTAAKLNTSNIDRSLNVASGNLGINNAVSGGASTKSGISFNAEGLITGAVILAAADLPKATTSAVGGVSIGAGLSITGAGALSITNSITANTAGAVKVTYNAQGQITGSSTLAAGDIPTATTSAKGAVQITSGGGLTVDGSGNLITSTSGVGVGTYQSVTVNAKGVITAGAALTATQIPSLAASKITSGTIDAARIGTDSIDGTKLSNSSTAVFQSIAQSGYPTAQFNGQILFDTVSEDAFIWDGNAWQAITTLTKGSLVFGGTFNASTSQMVATTSAGIAAGLAVGSNLPTPSATTDGVYVVVSASGTPSAPAPVVALAPPDYVLGITNSAGSSWNEVDLSQTVAGQVASNITFTPYGQISATNVQDALQELETEKMGFAGGTLTGQLLVGNTGSLVFEGSSIDAFETTIGVANPTASDKTILFPDVSGNVITSGDTNTVTSLMVDGSLVNTNLAANASIALSKLQAVTSAQIIVGNGSNVPTAVAVTGDIGINNAGLTSIAAGAIVNADINASAAIAGSKVTTGTTSAVGVLQLTDATNSTSTSTAATPNSVKTAFDLATTANTNAANAAQTTGATFTGNVIIDNAKEIRLSEADGDGANFTGLKAQAQSADIVLTLPAVAPTTGQVLKSSSTATTLEWATDSATDATKLPLAGGTLTGNLILNAQSDVRFADADSSHYVALQSPGTIASSFTLTLPSTDAAVSGYVLASDGSGTLSWVDPGSSSSPTFTGDATLTNDGALVGFSNLNATYTGNTKTLTVTVASKTAAHRYYGSGSSSGYKIDGKESPFLTLTPGRTYKFDQADGSNSGHPLRFYLEADKTTAYTTGVTTNGTAGSSNAYTQIVVSDTTPQVLHYQCSSHASMGNSVQTNSNIASTAKTLATARTIGGVSFDGSANINLAGVNATGNQNTTGTSGGFTAGNASNLNSGTVSTARLGSGTASSSVFLRGDGSWAAAASGVSSDAQYNTIGGTGPGSSFSGTSATDNTLFGFNAGASITTGDCNTAIGSVALSVGTTVQRTVAIGVSAGKNFTDGWSVFIGHDAGKNNTTGTGIAIGFAALGINSQAVTGSFNIAIGSETLYAATSGGYNVVVGEYAAKLITTGHKNTIIGYGACQSGNTALTTGDNNIVIGNAAGASSATVDNEITLGNGSITKFRIPGIDFVLKDNGGTPSSGQVLTADGSGEGYWATVAGGLSSDAQKNTVGGTNAGDSFSGTDAINNTLIGYDAGTAITSGDKNSLIGCDAGKSITTGYNNVALGYQSLEVCTTAANNIAIGATAAKNLTTGNGSVFIGAEAGGTGTITGTKNVCIGDASGMTLSSGDYNVLLGAGSGYGVTTGYENTYIGQGAGASASTGHNNIAVGHDCMANTAVSGSYNVGMGFQTFHSLTSGVENVAIGALAGYNLTSGQENTMIGYGAASDLTTGSFNIAIGEGAQASSASVSNECTIGNTTITKFRVPGIDFVLKDNGGTPSSGQVLTADGNGEGYWAAVAGGVSSDAQYNTVGGTNAGDSFSGTSATDNTLFGYDTGTAIDTGDKNSCFGTYAGASITSGNKNVHLGSSSAGSLTTGYENVFAGFEVAQSATTAYRNVCLGTEAGGALTTGTRNAFIGDRVKWSGSSGAINDCTYIGSQAGARADGNKNIAIGSTCLSANSFTASTGGYNIAIGTDYVMGNITTAHSNIAIGTSTLYAATTAHTNTAIGHKTLEDCDTGRWNTAVGATALPDLTGGLQNTAVGTSAGNYVTTGDNNLLLGASAGTGISPSGNITTGDNAVCLGNNNISALYCADTSISSSDSRDKTDVTNFTHGLNWVNQLNPITYRWDKRSWYDDNTPDGSKKRNKKHIGFLAQDVLAVEQADGFASKKDDMLVVNLNEDDTAYGLKYERLVPVLVNAIKELSAKVETLEAKLA